MRRGEEIEGTRERRQREGEAEGEVGEGQEGQFNESQSLCHL